MKNALEIFLETSDIKEFEAIDKLQDAGIISSECVYASHVSDGDAVTAVEWLKNRAN